MQLSSTNVVRSTLRFQNVLRTFQSCKPSAEIEASNFQIA
jgi:hypothetical protein